MENLPPTRVSGYLVLLSGCSWSHLSSSTRTVSPPYLQVQNLRYGGATPFNSRDVSICGFWYPLGSPGTSAQCPMDTQGQLHTFPDFLKNAQPTSSMRIHVCMYVYVQIYRHTCVQTAVGRVDGLPLRLCCWELV